MQTMITRLRTLRPTTWLAIIAITALACALPLALRARASSQEACLVEADDHDDHDHAGGESEAEEAVIELDDEALALAELKAERVRLRSMDAWLEAPGVLHANPDESAIVSPSVAGTVEAVRASVGDRVKQGQVLVTLRCPELATAQAEAAAAAAELAAAEEALKRRRALASEGGFASPPYEKARRAFDEARENLRLAEDNLDRARRLAELGTESRPAAEEAASDLSEARQAVRAAEAELASAKASLSTAERVASRAELPAGKAAARTAAEAKFANAETALQTARANTARLQSLLPDGLATEQEVAESQAAEAEAKADLEAARYELRTADTSADEARLGVTTAEHDVMRAEVALREAEARLKVAESRHEREQTVADENLPGGKQVAEAETQVAVARAALHQAKLAWEREQRLHTGDVRSREALADLEADVASARARLEAAERIVDALGQGRQGGAGRISIVAPVSGKISNRQARVGAMAGPGEPLLEITGVQCVWVEASFYEKDVPQLAVGQPMQVEVAAFPGQTLKTTVSAIEPGLDEHTRKATVRGILDNPSGRLLPDMFAKVKVRVGTTSGVLAVAEQSVQSDGHCEFVFVEEERGRYRRVEVRTGSHSDGLIEIRGGLEVGQTVVTQGAFLLKSEGSEIEDSCGH
jgi:RND family efflux transporter MFP subunit